MTQPFCGTCNRLRLTADGAIRNCLFSDDEHAVRDLLRDGGTDAELAHPAPAGGVGQAARPRDQRARVPATGPLDVDDRRLAVAVLRLFGPAREAAGVARADIPGRRVAEVLRGGRGTLRARRSPRCVAVSRDLGQRERRDRSTAQVGDEDEVAVVPRSPAGDGTGPSDEDGRRPRRLTHVDEHGKAHMVDVTGKPPTRRVAEARCSVRTSADMAALLADPLGGADLIESARFSGMLAAKKTSSLIPLCHPIRIDGVTVDIESAPEGFRSPRWPRSPSGPGWRWRPSPPAPPPPWC